MTDDEFTGMSDEDLEGRLRGALTPAETEPSDTRVASLRAAVDQARGDGRRTATPTGPAGRHARSTGHGVTRRRVLAVAAGVALLATGGVVGAVVDDRVRGGEDLLARGTPEFTATATGPGLEVTIDGDAAPEGRIMTLRSGTLPVLQPGGYYELWFLLGDDGRERISAGTFHPDAEGNTLVVLHAAVDPRGASGLEITREPGDGDPTSSEDVVARGAIDLR